MYYIATSGNIFIIQAVSFYKLMKPDGDEKMNFPIITGHTGNDETKENSLDSVMKCISLGADVFEIDVRRDENSILILSHYEQRQDIYDSCLRLAEVFEIAAKHPEIGINCDLKEEGLPLEVATLAACYGVGPERLNLTGLVAPSFLAKHPEVAKMADIYMNAENILEGIYFEIVSSEKSQISQHTFYQNPWKHLRAVVTSIEPYIATLSEKCIQLGVKGINLPYLSLTDEGIREFKRNGIPISVWTVNDEKEMVRFFRNGVKNLTTLDVSTAKSVRKDMFGF